MNLFFEEQTGFLLKGRQRTTLLSFSHFAVHVLSEHELLFRRFSPSAANNEWKMAGVDAMRCAVSIEDKPRLLRVCMVTCGCSAITAPWLC